MKNLVDYFPGIFLSAVTVAAFVAAWTAPETNTVTVHKTQDRLSLPCPGEGAQ